MSGSRTGWKPKYELDHARMETENQKKIILNNVNYILRECSGLISTSFNLGRHYLQGCDDAYGKRNEGRAYRRDVAIFTR